MKVTLPLMFLGFAACTTHSFAAITITGSSGPGGSPSAIIFSHDINLTISNGVPPFQGSLLLVLDDWVNPVNQYPTSGQFHQGLNTYINDQAAYSGVPVLLGWGINQAAVGIHDGILSFSFARTWQQRDTFTIKAGYYSFQTSGTFEPLSGTTFSGDVFLANNSFQRVSSVLAIPEPGTAALLLMVVSGFLVRRR